MIDLCVVVQQTPHSDPLCVTHRHLHRGPNRRRSPSAITQLAGCVREIAHDRRDDDGSTRASDSPEEKRPRKRENHLGFHISRRHASVRKQAAAWKVIGE